MDNINKKLLENVAKPQGGKMTKYNLGTRNCGTCETWLGPREIALDRKSVNVSTPKVEGSCAGRCKPFMKKAKEYCSGWSQCSKLGKKRITEIVSDINEILEETSQTTGHKNVVNVTRKKKEKN